LASGRVLPSDCIQLEELHCKLRLFKRPSEEWDRWKVQVYFTASPNPEQRKAFREMMHAWKTVGEFKGVGGYGIDRFKGLQFQAKTESAFFEADMGSADPGTARCARR
jgi:hypothetical protein